MKTSETNAADDSAIWLPPRSSTNSTVAVRNETITSAASEPIAWIGSARASSKPRLTDANGPRPSSSAAGIARPTIPSQMTAGRIRKLQRKIVGTKSAQPTAAATAMRRATGGSFAARSTPPINDAVIRNAPAVSTNTRSHQPGITLAPTAVTAGPSPSASDGQKCRP
jgi:hypothetical protein